MQSSTSLDNQEDRPLLAETQLQAVDAPEATPALPIRPVGPVRREFKPWVPGEVEALETRQQSTPTLAHTDSSPADMPNRHVRRSWVVICFCLTMLIYLAAIPKLILYSNPPTGDQAFYLMVMASIVQDRDLNIANNYGQRDEDKFYSLAPRPPGTVGMSAPYPVPPLTAYSTNRPPEEMYDFRQPGLPLMLAPAWFIGSLFKLWWPMTVIFMCVLGSLLAANIFLAAYQLTGRLWIASAVWLPMAFSGPIMSFSLLIFTEVATALLVLYAFRRIAMGWGANGPLRMALVGFCIGYIPWMSWRNIPVSLGLIAYAAVQTWRYYRSHQGADSDAAADSEDVQERPNLLPRLIALAVPLGVVASLLAAYNIFLFGTLTPPNRVPELGEQSPFLWPWQGGKEFVRFVTTGYALLFDRQAGLLVYTPIYLLAIVGFIAMFRSARRSDRRLLFWFAVTALPYFALLMAYLLWSGLWGPPARFMTVIVPLLSVPLAMSLLALERSLLYKLTYALLAIPGIFFMAIMVNDARFLWPANPIFVWLANSPNSPVNIDLWNSLPSIEHLDTLHLPANTLWPAAVIAAIVVLSYFLMSYQRPRWTERTLPLYTQGVLWVLALGMVGGSWYVVNAEYLRPRTLLIEQNRWQINVDVAGPQGMTYLDNKLYFADLEKNALVAMDLGSGTFSVVQLTGATNVVGFTRPTDVIVGPDNLLYVLNNGEGNPGVLVVRPDGTFVRALQLEGKSSTASGIDIGPDGSIWVADTVGGRVIKYGPEGGTPISDLTYTKFGFNNIMDVAAAEDGSVFVTDQSHPDRIVQVGANGELVRSYETQFNPWYLDRNGEWVDVTYDQGFISMNLRTGEVRESRVAEPGAPLAAPKGITHGPDGTLYILDLGTRTITAYKAQR